MGSENSNGKVPLISKIAYGFGDVGCNFSWMFVSNFLMIFYTDVFGISMAAVSALMLFSRFWDAINDPIVGGLTDKTKTRWGRYRPWLLVAAPITAVLLVLTFWARPDWSETSKIVYMVITYCLLVLGYTCVNIPYGTLCGAMTQDIDERAKINTSRSVAAMIAIGILNIITVPLISKFGSESAKTGYLTVAILYGCISTYKSFPKISLNLSNNFPAVFLFPFIIACDVADAIHAVVHIRPSEYFSNNLKSTIGL